MGLLEQKNGATLAEIMTVTGRQARSLRGFISGHLATKLGMNVESAKSVIGERTYQVVK